MATYIPGVEDSIPQSEPFVPDYKFLSDVLAVRQDRYDKNYKQLNDVYGKVVYADLTRNENKYVRDQYAEQLAPQIKQISGLDLSLQENVDAAYALFKPFYENESVIKDLTATATLKNERQKMASFKDSPIRAVREKYWDYGQQGLDIWEEDFKNADRQEALTMGLPQYIEDVDLVEWAEMLLDDSKLGDTEDIIISQDNKWIIKQKSGSLITAVPTGKLIKVKDENGKEIEVPQTKNLALEYIKDRLADDPNVQAAYHLRNYVDMRNYVKENSEAAGGDDNAKKQWANETIEKYTKNFEDDIVDLEKIKSNKKLTVLSWEAYAKKIGIKPGSKQDIDFLNSLDSLKLLDETIQNKKEKLVDITAATSDLKDLLHKAYTVAMGTQMGTDMLSAASSYAHKTMTRDMEINPEWKLWAEHQYRVQEKLLQSAIDRNKEEKENVKTPPRVPLLRRKKGDQTNLAGDFDMVENNIDGGTPGYSDAISYNLNDQEDYIDNFTLRRKELIKKVYGQVAQQLDLNPSKFTPIFSPSLMVRDREYAPGTLIKEGPLKQDEHGFDGRPISGAVGDGSVAGDIAMVQGNIERSRETVEDRIVMYPKNSAMTWQEFDAIDDPNQIHNMYTEMVRFINNAETLFPSFTNIPQAMKTEINGEIYNLRGDMSYFTEKSSELSEKFMETQRVLMGSDTYFNKAINDGGSIFDADGIVIPRDEWVDRYVTKWLGITNREMNASRFGAINDPLVTGDWENLDAGHFGTDYRPNYIPLDFDLSSLNDSVPMVSDTGYSIPPRQDFSAINPAPDSLQTQMQIAPIDSTDNQLSPDAYNAMGGRYWAFNPMGSGMTDAWGNQLYVSPEAQTHRMYEDAQLYYDYMYKTVNQKMTSTPENSAEFGYNFSAAMEGMPMQGDDMSISPVYQFTYDHNADDEQNSGAMAFFNNIIYAMDEDPTKFSIVAGGDYLATSGETLGQHNQEMEVLFNEAYNSVAAQYGNPNYSPKEGGIIMNISYSKNIGGENIDAAGYTITFNKEWVDKRQANYNATAGDYAEVSSIVTNTNSPDFFKDYTMTILIEKELDNNIYKTGNVSEQRIMAELNQNNGIIERNIPNGGAMTVYELSPGVYMYSDWYWDIQDGEQVKVPLNNMQVPRESIGNILATQEAKLQQIATSNLDLIKSFNITNNFTVGDLPTVE